MHANCNWIGNATPGDRFPRQLFHVDREVRSQKAPELKKKKKKESIYKKLEWNTHNLN